MAGSRALARLQLLVALLLALVCIVHGQLESRPPPLDAAGRPLSREKRQNLKRRWKKKRQTLYKLKKCHSVDGRRVGVVEGFDFKQLKQWAPRKNKALTAMRDVLTLQLPEKGGEEMINKTGIVMYSSRVNTQTVRIFGFIQDETTEELERHENATFTLYLNETTHNLQGNVRLYDRLFSYRTNEGRLTVTELPLLEGMCDIPSSLAKKTGGHASSPRHLHAAHEHKHEHAHKYEHAHAHDDIEARHSNRQLRHKHHLEHVARVLAAGKSPRPFLIFVNLDVVEGPHPQWGDVTNLLRCPESFATPERLQSILDEVREDYAPFDVEVTADKAVYDAWEYNRVKANVVDKVTLSGKLMSCGVAFMNTYSQVDNNVWASCDCGGPGATAGTISHEVGHTFGLRHDGDVTRPTGKTTREYLFSLPKYDMERTWPKSRRWNTIMGGSIETGIRQWNAGTYPDASNTAQDDVEMLRKTIGERPGMMCNQVFPMRDLSDGEPFTFPQTAIICAEGVDSYFVRMSGGPVRLEVMTPKEPNLKFRLRVSALDESLDVTGSPVGEVESNPYVSPLTELEANLARPGPYLITIQSIAQEASDESNGYAFPVYGSMGFYTLTVDASGKKAPVKKPQAPHSPDQYYPHNDDTSFLGAQSCYTSPGLGLATLFGKHDETPESMDVTEYQPMSLGTRFRANVAGEIRAVRFYKSPSEGGSGHVGKIYDWDSGELLASTVDAASGVVIDDSACPGPGWVTIDLPTPLSVEPGREYMVALDSLYYYVKNDDYVLGPQWNNELEAVEQGAKFGYEGSMPTMTWQGGENFWIDVVMSPTDFMPSTDIVSPLATPYVPLTDVVCHTWPTNGYQTIFGPYDEPQEVDIKVELATRLVLGLRFRTMTDGYITAVRFYKAVSEGGWGHQGCIYDWMSGELLATTIDDVDDYECAAPGWVSIPLKVPFYTAADTEYVVALDGVEYYAKSSYTLTETYAVNEFIVMGEGGLFGQTQGEMPMESWLGSSNYWVDVEFTRDLSQPGQLLESNTIISSTPTKKQTKAPTKKPKKKATTPKKKVAKPKKTAAPTPKRKATIPKKKVATPKKVTTTKKKAPTPKKKAPTAKPVRCNRWPSTTKGVQTLFTRSDVPDVDDATEGMPMVLGLRLKPTAAGLIRAIRFYKPTSEAGQGHTGRIYTRRDGQLVASTIELDDSECQGPCWVSLPFATPVRVEAGIPYVVALDNVYYYAKSEDYFTAPAVKGNLGTRRASGVFGYTPGEMPLQAQHATNYWIDVEYKPTASPTVTKGRRKLFARRQLGQ